jgi:hypothetical protein
MEKSSSVISLMIPLLDAALFEGQGTLYVCEELEEATIVLYTISSSAANPKQNLLGSFCSIVELLSVLLILHSKKHAFTDVGKISCGWWG